jgi:small ligand-binding sensory domain FIST
VLNMGTPLLEGLGTSLGKWPPVIGLGLHGDPRWRPGPQYVDDRLETQSVIGVVLSGTARMTTMMVNNLRPMSTYREITSVDGPAVLRIDGRPALEVIEDLVGPDLRWENYPLTVTLGVNKGDKFGDFREEEYASYLCIAVDRERRALVMSDTYLQPGMQCQLMRRQIDFAEIRKRADALVESVRDRRPFFAMYVDCAGRASAYVGTDREDAEEIQKAVGPLPLLGVYSGSEIARVGQDRVT